MNDPSKEFSVWRWRPDKLAAARDRVAVEEPLEIRIAGEPDLAAVIPLHFCGTATDPMLPPNVVDVQLTEAALARRGRRHLEVSYSSCGLCAKEAVSEICAKVPPVASDLTVPGAALPGLMDRLHEFQAVFKETGGTHAVALARPDGQLFLCAEDVGRHNAMDKVIGRGVLTRQDFAGLVAVLSGRISFEMALKTARAGIPILAAVSAPTSMALELARELNLTTVGFLREQRFTIYTHPERVKG
jgi:FdhD protein